MTKRVAPLNLTAQLSYRPAGTPPGGLVASSVGNYYPGLEVDLRNLRRRLFVGIVLHEAVDVTLAPIEPSYTISRHVCQIAASPPQSDMRAAFLGHLLVMHVPLHRSLRVPSAAAGSGAVQRTELAAIDLRVPTHGRNI